MPPVAHTHIHTHTKEKRNKQKTTSGENSSPTNSASSKNVKKYFLSMSGLRLFQPADQAGDY